MSQSAEDAERLQRIAAGLERAGASGFRKKPRRFYDPDLEPTAGSPTVSVQGHVQGSDGSWATVVEGNGGLATLPGRIMSRSAPDFDEMVLPVIPEPIADGIAGALRRESRLRIRRGFGRFPPEVGAQRAEATQQVGEQYAGLIINIMAS